MFFFFFKQKTAYEMRISDWSSDVCSSDLGPRGQTQGRCTGPGTDVQHRFARRGGNRRREKDRIYAGPIALDRLAQAHAPVEQPEIGRASCRERGCPSV